LAFFVYGTLRRGEANWARLLAPLPHTATPALLPGASLYVLGLPYVVKDGGGGVRGELIEPHLSAADYTSLLDRLDRLEGHPHHYRRQAEQVMVADAQTAMAWVYLASPATASRLLPEHLVPGGDWLSSRPGG